MALLEDYLPPFSADVLRMEPEELGPFLLKFLRALEAEGSKVNRLNLIRPEYLEDYAPDWSHDMARRLTEAWMWLEGEGFLAPDPEQSGDFRYVTERARAMLDSGVADPATFRAAKYLPEGSLHPALARRARPAYLRGENDTAVFEAMKAVEVAVRRAGSLSARDIGVPLMRKAFHSEMGALRDPELVTAERQATSDLFAGAIGLFKNPSSHRDVDLADPIEVAGVIRLADVLLRMVDRATPEDGIGGYPDGGSD